MSPTRFINDECLLLDSELLYVLLLLLLPLSLVKLGIQQTNKLLTLCARCQSLLLPCRECKLRTNVYTYIRTDKCITSSTSS